MGFLRCFGDSVTIGAWRASPERVILHYSIQEDDAPLLWIQRVAVDLLEAGVVQAPTTIGPPDFRVLAARAQVQAGSRCAATIACAREWTSNFEKIRWT